MTKWPGGQGAGVSLILLLTAHCSLPADSHALELHGFLQGNYSARVTGEDPPARDGSDYLLSEERFQLKVSETSKDGSASLFLRADLFRDGIDEEVDLVVREGYLDYTRGRFDLRLGRQIITWGTGDLIFINDVFPKDYNAFYSGRPMEYLKVPVDGLKMGIASDVVSAEVLVIPTFEANRLPDSRRFYLYDPYPSVTNRTSERPDKRLRDVELAVRLYRYFGSTDVSLYAYRGFSRMPGIRPDVLPNPSALTYFYPELAVYGASASFTLLGGVANIEGGYYDSLEDRSGTDPAVENSRWKFLAGYRKEIGTDFTVGLQYYMELMEDYNRYRNALPAGSPKDDRVRDYATLRLTKMLLYQTLKLSLFGMYSPSDEDYLLNPEGSYKLTDEITFTIGGNIFGGRTGVTPFGQLEKNDNVYANLRYEF